MSNIELEALFKRNADKKDDIKDFDIQSKAKTTIVNKLDQ